MRSVVLLTALVAVGVSATPLCASSLDDQPVDAQTIAALEARAEQAQPREQCFLYAQIVHQMTELSMREYSAGNLDHATSLLKRIQSIAQKIHLSIAGNDKRLKNAEILLSHTAFRLNELLHSSGYDDRQLVQETLSQVNHAQTEAMMTVFQK
ncbi:MAG TPA: hypothetical protein VL986_08625 [Terracidiphilus sp.]|nr:hypothetical protein [Terracidiphilus sp.]